MRLEKLKPYGIDLLFDAILTLKTPEECYAFFDDLCTINELKAFGQRLMVAKMLREGETYAVIEAKTGASTATISRVKRSLHFGNDGYELAFNRLAEQGKLPPGGKAGAGERAHGASSGASSGVRSASSAAPVPTAGETAKAHDSSRETGAHADDPANAMFSGSP
ncbi:MAG: hypothetical protein IMW86_02645 [Hydrogenibacillus sp.]|nr:hypothetical protein [Hydrogenibacillus sp.]